MSSADHPSSKAAESLSLGTTGKECDSVINGVANLLLILCFRDHHTLDKRGRYDDVGILREPMHLSNHLAHAIHKGVYSKGSNRNALTF